MKFWLSLFLLFFISLLQADPVIYTWSDDQGRVHYADIPGDPNASVLSLSGSEMQVNIAAANPALVPVANPVEHKPHYELVTITAPLDNSTSVNNEKGSVTVSVQLKPALQTEDSLQLVLDAKPQGCLQKKTTINLENIDRGKHTLQALIINAKHEVIATSNVVTFFMQRPQIK